jgi:membrane-associated phospholipid phosphatase
LIHGADAPVIRRRPIDAVLVLVGVALLLGCGWVARNGTVGPFERSIFEAINGLPDRLSPVMQGAQFLGVLAVGPLAALIALVMRRYRLAVAAVLVTIGKLGAERIVWQVVQRQRPGVSEPNAIVRGGTPTNGLSFVSGHVVLVTGLAFVIAPYLRGKWRLVPWVVVAFVGFARIYLGAHNPVDVLGGVALGLALGALTNLVVGVPETSVPEASGVSVGRPDAPDRAAGGYPITEP